MHLCLIGPLNYSNKQSVILCLVVRWKLVRERHQSIQFIIFLKKNFCDAKHLVILRITRDVFLNLFFFSLDSKGSCNQKWMSTNIKITTRGDNTGKIIFICQKKKKKNFHPHLLDTPALVAETNSLWLPCDGNREAAVPPRGTRATCQWRCSEILFFFLCLFKTYQANFHGPQ